MQNKNLKLNIFYNIVYQFLILIIPLISSPYISRKLGVEMSGVYSYTYSIVYYFMMFGRLGISTYGNRYIAKVRDDKEKLSRAFCSLVIFQLLASFLMIVIYIFYNVMFVTENKIIHLIQSIFILANMFDITWFFFGLEEFKLTLSRNIIIKVFSLILIFILVKNPNDLWIYTTIMAGSTFLGQIAVWPFLKKRIYFVKPKASEVLSHFKPNLILFIPSIAISIFSIMDKIMLGVITQMTDVGFYEYSEKIISIPKSMISSLGTAMLPRMSNIFAKGKVEQAKQYIKSSFLYVSITSSALVFGIMSIAKIFAPVYWGSEYAPCGLLIIVLCPGVIFSLIGNVIRTQYIIPLNRDKEYVISLVAGAAFNLIANIILIPKLGALGASITTVLAELIMTGIQIFVVRKELDLKKYFRGCYKYFGIGMVMFVINYIISLNVEPTILNLLILIFVGAIIYIILFLIIFIHSKNDFEQNIKKAITSKFKGGKTNVKI